MEKICSWYWRPVHNGPQQEDSFWYDADRQWVSIARSGATPDGKQGYSAPWLLEMLARKNYDRLKPNMQQAYDFLKTKVGAIRNG